MPQLCRQHTLSQHLLELCRKARFAMDQLGVLVLHLGQQLVNQIVGTF